MKIIWAYLQQDYHQLHLHSKGLTGQTLGAILNAMGALIFTFAVSFSPLMFFTEIVREKQNAKKFGTTGSTSSNSEVGGNVYS